MTCRALLTCRSPAKRHSSGRGFAAGFITNEVHARQRLATPQSGSETPYIKKKYAPRYAKPNQEFRKQLAANRK
jgi:hypothetical protein